MWILLIFRLYALRIFHNHFFLFFYQVWSTSGTSRGVWFLGSRILPTWPAIGVWSDESSNLRYLLQEASGGDLISHVGHWSHVFDALDATAMRSRCAAEYGRRWRPWFGMSDCYVQKRDEQIEFLVHRCIPYHFDPLSKYNFQKTKNILSVKRKEFIGWKSTPQELWLELSFVTMGPVSWNHVITPLCKTKRKHWFTT